MFNSMFHITCYAEPVTAVPWVAVRCDYDRDFVSGVKEVPFAYRKWLPKSKTWLVHETRVGILQVLLTGLAESKSMRLCDGCCFGGCSVWEDFPQDGDDFPRGGKISVWDGLAALSDRNERAEARRQEVARVARTLTPDEVVSRMAALAERSRRVKVWETAERAREAKAKPASKRADDVSLRVSGILWDDE